MEEGFSISYNQASLRDPRVTVENVEQGLTTWPAVPHDRLSYVHP